MLVKITERMLNAMQDNLQYIRVYLNLTQKEFGELVGLSEKTIYNIENRKVVLKDNEYILLKDSITEYMDKINLINCLKDVVNSLMQKRKLGNTNTRYVMKNFPKINDIRRLEAKT